MELQSCIHTITRVHYSPCTIHITYCTLHIVLPLHEARGHLVSAFKPPKWRFVTIFDCCYMQTPFSSWFFYTRLYDIYRYTRFLLYATIPYHTHMPIRHSSLYATIAIHNILPRSVGLLKGRYPKDPVASKGSLSSMRRGSM